MNKEENINKLFNQAKDQSPLLDLDEVKEIIASGRELHISQKQKIKFNKSGLPKKTWFNLKNIFVMTGFIATVTVSILIVYPTLKQSKQSHGYLKDQATIQKNKNIQNEQIGYQRKDTLSIEMISEKQENFINTKQISPTKLSRIPRKESSFEIVEHTQTSTNKSIRNQSSEVENKSPKIVDKVILINDTIFKGDHLILDLSNEQLVGLGFLIDGTGFYYKNQIPSGVKIGLWSRYEVVNDRGSGEFGMHTFQDKSNRHNKQSLTSLDFYPVFVTTTLGKRLAYLDNNVDKSDEYFSSVNDTLIPVLLKYSQVKGYFQNDVVVWFYPTPNFFKQIPFPRAKNIEALYNRIKSLKEIQPYKNIANYPLLEKFVVAPMKGVNTITLDPINLKALGFKKTFEGYTYLNQLDEKAYIHLNVNVKVVQKLFISYKFWMGNKSYAINVNPPKNEPIKPTKLNFYPLFITYMDGELVFYKKQYGNMLSQKLINLLVPVKIKDQEFVDKNDTLLLWFTPTKTFFKALPSNIGEELMEEYERYSNPDSFKESKDYRYFESLFSTLSCVEDVTVYPNPASTFINIDLLVINPCSFKIGIYDLNGVNVLETGKTYQYSLAGRYSETINLKGLKSSIYFLLIFNEKGERITKRIILNNN